MSTNEKMREALRDYDKVDCKNAHQQLNKAERTIERFRQALAEPAEYPEGFHNCTFSAGPKTAKPAAQEPAGEAVQPDFSDAYQGARQDAEIWKKRALEAEELNRKFIAQINDETFMGEPAQPVRKALADLNSVALVAHHGGLIGLSESDALKLIRKLTVKHHDWRQTIGEAKAALDAVKGGV